MTDRLADLDTIIAQCTDAGVVLSARIERLTLLGCEHGEIRKAIGYGYGRGTWEAGFRDHCLELTGEEMGWLADLEAACIPVGGK